MQIKKNGDSHEVNEMRLVCLGENAFEVADICGKTPFDDLVEKEQRGKVNLREREEMAIRQEAISGMIAYIFKPVSGQPPTAIEVTKRIYVLTYTLRPELIEGWSLEKIAGIFETSRQTFSARLVKQNESAGLRARTQKSTIAVSKYREGTTKWHAERKEEERKQKRREYLKAYRKANAAELRAYQAQYREKNKERLNAARRKTC